MLNLGSVLGMCPGLSYTFLCDVYYMALIMSFRLLLSKQRQQF